MISTRSVISKGLPLVAQKVLQQQAGAMTRALSTIPFNSFYSDGKKERRIVAIPRITGNHQLRFASFSANAVSTKPGTVTKNLRVLDIDVVKQIIEELRSVDVNSDGR